MDSNKPSSIRGNTPPSGSTIPTGIEHPQSTSSKGDVQTVAVNEKQIPRGIPPEHKPLQQWDITHAPLVPPKIPKPRVLNDTGLAGERVREAVLNQLKLMLPDFNKGQLQRVSDEHQAEMANRIALVQKSLGLETIRQAAKEELLIDLEPDSQPEDVTLNTVLTLAGQIRHAEGDVLNRVNSDNTNVEIWKKGILDFRTLQKAWKELHIVVTEICTHEPMVVLPSQTPLVPSRQALEKPDGRDLLLTATGAPIPRQEAKQRITMLEQELASQREQLNQLKQSQNLNQQLKAKDEEIAALQRSELVLFGRNKRLQSEIVELKKQLQHQTEALVDGQQLQKLQSDIQKLQQGTRAFQQKNKELRSELQSELQRVRSELEKELQTAVSGRSSAENQTSRIRGELHSAQAKIDVMRCEQESLIQDTKNLEQSLRGSESDLQSLQAEYEVYKAEQISFIDKTRVSYEAQLKEKEKEKEDEVNFYKLASEKAERNAESLRKNLAEEQRLKNQLEVQLKSLEEQSSVHVKAIDEKNTEIDRLQEVQGQLSSSQLKLEKAEQAREEEVAKSARLEKEKTQAVEARQEVESSLTSAQVDIAHLQDEQQATQAEMKQQQQNHQEALLKEQKVNAELEQTKAKLNKELLNSKRRVAELNEIIQVIEHESSAAGESAVLKSSKVIKKLQAKVKELTDEGNEARAKTVALEEALGAAEQRHEDELFQLKETNSQLVAEHEKKIEELKRVHLIDLTSRVQQLEEEKKNEVEERDHENDALKEELIQLRSDQQIAIEAAGEEKEKVQALRDEKDAALSNAEEQYKQQLQDAKQDAEDVLQSTQADFDEKKHEYEEELSNLRAAVSQLQSAQKTVGQLEGQLSDATEQAKEQIQVFESKVLEEQSKYRALEREHDEKLAVLISLQKNVTASEAAVTQLNGKISALEKTVVQQDFDAAAVEARRQLLTDELEETKSELESNTIALEDNERARQQLESKLTSQAGELEQLILEKQVIKDEHLAVVRNLEDKNQALEERVLVSERSVKELDQTHALAATKAAEAIAEISEIQKQLEQSNEERGQEIQALTAALQTKQEKYKKRLILLSEMARGGSTLREELDEVNKKMAIAEGELSALRDQLDSATSENTSLLERASQAEENRDHLKDEQQLLNQAKYQVDEEILELKAKRDQQQSEIKRLEVEIEALTPEEKTYANAATQSGLGQSDSAVQDDENVTVFLQHFAGEGISVSTGLLSSENYSDLESEPSAGGGEKSLRFGNQNEAKLEVMVHSAFDELNIAVGKRVHLDIAYENLKKKIDDARTDLDHTIEVLKENDAKQSDSILGEPVDEPPSHKELRMGVEKAYTLFSEQLINYRDEFITRIDKEEGHNQTSANEVRDALELALMGARAQATQTRILQQEFEKEVSSYNALLEQIEQKTPDQMVNSAHVFMKVALTKQKDQELRDYIVCSFASATIEKLKQNYDQAMESIQDDEIKRRVLEDHKRCLLSLTPEELPLQMGESIGPLGAKYMSNAVRQSISELEGDLILRNVDGENQADVRGKAGPRIALEMITDPEIRPAVLSLFSSLKNSSEEISTEISYAQASEAGLKFIRSEFGLLQLPTMSELLTVALKDLEQPWSLLVSESELQHRGKTQNKEGVTRRDKLQALCRACETKEKELEDDSEIHFRGQALTDGQLAQHPHAGTLDCFKPDGKQKVFDTSLHGRGNKTEAGFVTDIKPSTNGLLNNFLSNTPGKATLLTNETARVQYIQLKNGQPEDIKFKCSANGDWQVSMANSLWSVDPAFLLENPNLSIPFEGKEAGRHQQDWIPVKSRSGETGVLVLRKIPGQVRYFLYEKGDGNVLVPRVIGHTDPQKEKQEAAFLYAAAIYDPTNPDTAHIKPTTSVQSQLVLKICGAKPCWLKETEPGIMQVIYDQVATQVKNVRTGCPLPMVRQVEFLENQQVSKTPVHDIAANKRSRQVSHDVASAKGIKSEHNGLHLHAYQPKLYAKAITPATFDEVGRTFTTESSKAGELKPVWVEGQKRDREEFRNGAFKQLLAYHGCELNPEKNSKLASTLTEGTPEYAQMVLRKAIKVNRDHRMRLAQQIDADCKVLVQCLRSMSPQEMKSYSDREVLNMAITEFESGHIPENLLQPMNKQNYVQLLTGIMLSRNDLEQTSELGQSQALLMKQLEKLGRDAFMLRRNDPEAYRQQCQQYNLEQALLATRQDEVVTQLERYHNNTLDHACRAQLSFEASVHTLLRENQVDEVEEALGQISDAMSIPGKTMSRISQKGTGWGKSTIIQLLSDHACSHNLAHPERSVLVIAPTSNQAELDITLGRYYAHKNRHYRSLNIQRDYADKDKVWWNPRNIDRIHNTLLGVDPDLSVEKREIASLNLRAPVGASVKDIQILMQLRRALQEKGRTSEEELSLRKLDDIADLVRKSMVFCDEWDSTLMPPRMEELQGMTVDINKALRALGSRVDPMNVVKNHAQLVLGCERKQLMSATTGSDYAAALASGEVEPEAIKAACHTDPFTTEQRFWHWLNSAQLIMVDGNNSDTNSQVVDQVIEIAGTDREVMIFDGRNPSENGLEQAINNQRSLTEARLARGGKERGTLFYDAQKQLHMYLPGHSRYGAKKGAPVPSEEEKYIRDTHGESVDVALGQAQSIGTDAPQGKRSVGVHMGLLEQGQEARLNYVSQQFGRLKRAPTDLRQSQDLFVVIDESALNRRQEQSEFLLKFNEAREEEKKSRASLEAALGKRFDQCTPAQKKILYSQPSFEQPKTAQAESTAPNQSVALNKELKKLSKSEWLKAEFTQPQIEALKEYKSREWHTKKASLKLIAAELAAKELNAQVKNCEEKLQEAKVDGYIDQTFSEEHAWLQSGQDGSLEKFRLQPMDYKVLESEEVVKFVEKGLIVESAKRISDIARRTSTETVSIDEVGEHIEIDPVLKELDSFLDEMEKDGITLSLISPLDDTKPYSGKAGDLLSVRQKLQTESLALCDKALNVVDEVIGQFETVSVTNLGPIKEKRDMLKGQMILIEEHSKNGIEAALATKDYLNKFYHDLFDFAHNVAMNDVNTIRTDLRRSGHKAVVDKIWKKLSTVMSIKPDDIVLTTTARGYQRAKIKFDAFQNAKLADKPKFKKEYLEAKELLDAKSKQGVKEGSYHAMAWQKTGGQLTTRPSVIINSPATDNAEMRKVRKKAEELQTIIDDQEKAKKFLSQPGSDAHKNCVDQLRTHILEQVQKRNEAVREKTEQEVSKIKQQEMYKQVRIVPTINP